MFYIEFEDNLLSFLKIAEFIEILKKSIEILKALKKLLIFYCYGVKCQ